MQPRRRGWQRAHQSRYTKRRQEPEMHCEHLRTTLRLIPRNCAFCRGHPEAILPGLTMGRRVRQRLYAMAWRASPIPAKSPGWRNAGPGRVGQGHFWQPIPVCGRPARMPHLLKSCQSLNLCMPKGHSERMPELGSALETAGCTVAPVLSHCFSGGEHMRGCWVIDSILGK